MTDFRLTPDDKATALWVRLKAHLDECLMLARIRNDRALTEMETAWLRGEIKTLKRILALGDVRPVLTGDGEQPPD